MRSVASFWDKEHFGRLLIRIVLGILLVALGVKYFTGGSIALKTLGAIVQALGITFWPRLWGILSATVLIFSGMCYVIGFYYRVNCGLLAMIFALKTIIDWKLGYHFFAPEFLCDFVIFTILMSSLFMGPGRFSSDGH